MSLHVHSGGGSPACCCLPSNRDAGSVESLSTAVVVSAGSHALGTTESVSVHLAHPELPSGLAVSPPQERQLTAGSHDQALQSTSATPDHQAAEKAPLHSQHRMLLSWGVCRIHSVSPSVSPLRRRLGTVACCDVCLTVSQHSVNTLPHAVRAMVLTRVRRVLHISFCAECDSLS